MAMTYGLKYNTTKREKPIQEKPLYTLPGTVEETIAKTKKSMKGYENKESNEVPECEQAVFNSAILEEDPVAYLMNYYKVTREAADKSLRHAQRMFPQDIWLVAQMTKDPVLWYAKTFNVGKDAARNRLRSYRYKYDTENTEKTEKTENNGEKPILNDDMEPEEKPRKEETKPDNGNSEDSTLSDIQKELDDIREKKEELLKRVKELEEQEKACVMVQAMIKNRKTK